MSWRVYEQFCQGSENTQQRITLFSFCLEREQFRAFKDPRISELHYGFQGVCQTIPSERTQTLLQFESGFNL